MTNFKLHNYGRGILHVTNPFPEELAYGFLRIQESSGNPRWIGRVFSEEKFLNWYDKLRAREEDGRWEYHKEYVGFSVPDSAFRAFYEGRYDPCSTLEQGLLKLLEKSTNRGKRTAFVIGSTEGDIHTMDHELSCALFHVDPAYRRQTLNSLQALPFPIRRKMNQWFIDDGSYLSTVIPREVVAEFADWKDSHMFKEQHIDRRNEVLQRVHREIRTIYEAGLQTLKLQ